MYNYKYIMSQLNPAPPLRIVYDAETRTLVVSGTIEWRHTWVPPPACFKVLKKIKVSSGRDEWVYTATESCNTMSHRGGGGTHTQITVTFT